MTQVSNILNIFPNILTQTYYHEARVPASFAIEKDVGKNILLRFEFHEGLMYHDRKLARAHDLVMAGLSQNTDKVSH